MITKASAVLLAAFLLAFGACGGSDDDTGDATPEATGAEQTTTATSAPGETIASPSYELIDQTGEVACALIAADEVSAIAGEEYSSGVPSVADCTFSAKSSAFKTIRLGVSDGPGAEAIFGAFLAGEGVIEVEGAGTRAAWSESAGRLDVLADQRIIHVVVLQAAPGDALTRALAIANATID